MVCCGTPARVRRRQVLQGPRVVHKNTSAGAAPAALCAPASCVRPSRQPPLQVDNEYTDNSRSEGLILDLMRMTNGAAGRKLSTSVVAPPFRTLLNIKIETLHTFLPSLPPCFQGL